MCASKTELIEKIDDLESENEELRTKLEEIGDSVSEILAEDSSEEEQ